MIQNMNDQFTKELKSMKKYQIEIQDTLWKTQASEITNMNRNCQNLRAAAVEHILKGLKKRLWK